MQFQNRIQAGTLLAEKLRQTRRLDSPVVVALPRGGVPIAFPIARMFHVPVDLLIVRKIGAPTNPEFGIGAITEGGFLLLDEETIDTLGISQSVLQKVIEKEQRELARRVILYRQYSPKQLLSHRTVLLVDDGLATGVSAKAAIETIRLHHPKKIIFASPVCAYETLNSLRHMVDSIVCLKTPYDLSTIGSYYKDFSPVSDEEVVRMLAQSYVLYHHAKLSSTKTLLG